MVIRMPATARGMGLRRRPDRERRRQHPRSPARALMHLEAWLAAPAAVLAEPTNRHAAVLHGLLRESGTAGNLTTDAHLAALAIEHGADIVSFDRDFDRFSGVRHRLPG
jgi:toxin-antitoxin system PIN domain toxin